MVGGAFRSQRGARKAMLSFGPSGRLGGGAIVGRAGIRGIRRQPRAAAVAMAGTGGCGITLPNVAAQRAHSRERRQYRQHRQ